MSTHGALHARMRLPAGTFWGVTVSYAGSGYVAMTTVSPSFDTYLVDILALMQTNLNTFHGTGWTVSADFSENGTGLVSVSKTGTTWGITWSSTAFRDVLGFTGNITGTAGQVQTGTLRADSVWLPGTPKQAQYKDANAGHYATDKRTTTAPTGSIKSIYGNKYVVIPQIRWNTVMEARARGVDTRGSWERFWYQSQLGEALHHEVGSTIKYYPDANSATNHVIRIPDMHDSEMKPTVDNWSGLYNVEIPKMVTQP